MNITSFEQFKELARRGTFVPVCKEIVADLLTPVSAFLKIAEHADYAFLLESVEGGEHVGRYSFLGKDPFLILRARDGRTTIERAGATTESDRPFIDTLRSLMVADMLIRVRESQWLEYRDGQLDPETWKSYSTIFTPSIQCCTREPFTTSVA